MKGQTVDLDRLPMTAPERGAAFDKWSEYAIALRDAGVWHPEIAAHLWLPLGAVRRLVDARAQALSRRWNGAIYTDPDPRPINWEKAKAGSARLFIAWLISTGVTWRDGHDLPPEVRNVYRHLRHFSGGDRVLVAFATADTVCTFYERHVSEVPDCVWQHGASASGAAGGFGDRSVGVAA